MNAKRVGVLAVLGAAVMWALEPNFAKLAYASAGVLETSAVRTITVVPIALAWLVMTRSSLRLGPRWPAMVYVGLMAAAGADVIYLWALSLADYPVVNAVLIGHLQPVFVVLMGRILLKAERLNRLDYLGIGIMVVSSLLVATRTWEHLRRLQFGTAGDGLVLVATLLWASTTLVARRYLRGLSAGTVTFWRFAIGAAVLWAVLAIRSRPVVLNGYQFMVGVVVAVGTLLYYVGLNRIKAAQVSAIELSSPFFAAVLAFLVHGERLTVMQAAGMILLAGGIACLARRETVLD